MHVFRSLRHRCRKRYAADSASSLYTYDANSNRLTSVDTTTSDTDLDGDFDQADYQKALAQNLNVDAASSRLLGFSQTQTITQTTAAGKVKVSGSNTQITYSLDAAGNLTSDGLRLFDYDASNRLSQVMVSQSGEASKIVYLHNALGQRVFKSEPQVAQTAPDETVLGTDFISWLKKNFGWLFAQAQANATLGDSFVYGDASIGSFNLLGQYGNGGSKSAGRIEYLYLPTEAGPATLVGIYKGGRVYAVHTDHLGTPRKITDDTNQVVWQWAYSAFGDNKPSGVLKATANPKVALTNVPTLLKATTPTLAMNLRFPGQYFDEESNLSYNYFRSYRPQQGRYDQADPIGLDGGWSRFGYVGGNSLSFVDPKGLSALPSMAMLEPAPVANMSRTPWAMPDACSALSSSILASNDSVAQRKTYCLAFCQYELDMPGRFDNFGPHRACMRRCMATGGFTM